MSRKFSQQEFADQLASKCPDPQPCPFCKSQNYRTFTKLSQLQVQDDMNNIIFGQSIPCGIVICENCGHIDLFALGPLGLKIR